MVLSLAKNALVVIPVGFTNIAQLPYFQPFLVTEAGITIEKIADELVTNLDELIY
jgi:hypothetical protein